MISTKIVIGEAGTVSGRGAIAIRPIETGELLWELDRDAPVVSVAEWRRLPPENRRLYSQCGDGVLYRNSDDEWCFNHSCDPNAGGVDGTHMVAMRVIQPGEEVVYDYGFSETIPDWRMLCACGTVHCRRMISNRDYLLGALQRRYAEYTPPYVRMAIARARPHQVLYHTLWSWSWRVRLRLRSWRDA